MDSANRSLSGLKAFLLGVFSLVGFLVILGAAYSLALKGLLTPEFVSLAGGYSLVASLVNVGASGTNVTERFVSRPKPPQ